MKLKITNKGLYWGLIATFGLLYLLVAFVSTLHAIDFFRLSNIGALAILLGVAYEVGQASVLFSILMTKNKEKFLPWLLMILLTALQVTANVYASFKHMSISGNDDWTYWYTSILKIFGVGGGTPETYQVIISWISGALLPIVALGMTALVAQNIKLITEEGESEEIGEPVDASDIISEVSRVRPTEDDLEMAEEILSKKKPEGYFEKEVPMGHEPSTPKEQEEINKIKKLMTMDPVESGAISDNLKKTISPGLELDDDLYPDTDVRGEATENLPEPDGKDHGEVWMPDLKDKKPESISEILGVEAQTPPVYGSETEQSELQTEQSEPETIPIEPQPVDIVNNNGLVDIEPKHMGEVLTDLSKRVEPETPPEPVETEEDKQERLREVAREKLKKK